MGSDMAMRACVRAICSATLANAYMSKRAGARYSQERMPEKWDFLLHK